MPKRITVMLDDEAAALLPRLAGGARKQGEYLSGLIRAAAARPAGGGATPEATELEHLRIQVRGIIGELQSLNARLVTLETQDE